MERSGYWRGGVYRRPPIALAIGTAALGVPRLAVLVAGIATDLLSDAFGTALVPFLGALFLPVTTIAFAVAAGPDGVAEGAVRVWVALGAVADAAMLWLAAYKLVEERLE